MSYNAHYDWLYLGVPYLSVIYSSKRLPTVGYYPFMFFMALQCPDMTTELIQTSVSHEQEK